MLDEVLLGLSVVVGLASLAAAWRLLRRPKPDMVVRCRGVAGTVIPKGFLVEWDHDTVWVTLHEATIGPEGWADIPAVKEPR